MSGHTPNPVLLEAAGAPEAGPRVGERIGAYRLRRLIGEGANGRVFEVEHVSLGRRDAMKILAPQHATRAGAVKRLFAEARAVNRIQHPNIVAVTDLIEADQAGGPNAIVMELLEGESLAQRIEREPRLAPEAILPIVIQIADALDAAHGAQIIHRDLKPENIFLVSRAGQDELVKLLDFGLAKSMAEEGDRPAAVGKRRSHVTAEGAFVGTPAYAAPEQASGKPIDHRTDLYALGVIIYELLCGRLPFEGKNMADYLVKHLTEPVPPPAAEVATAPLGAGLAAVALRCLEKNPAARFGSAREVKERLEQVQRGLDPGTAGPPVEAPGPPADLRWLVAAAAALLVPVGLAVAVLSSRPPARATPVAAAAPAPFMPSVVPIGARGGVALTFESDPPGAEVIQADADVPLGTTPFRMTFPRGKEPLEIEARLPGYPPVRQTVSLKTDATISLRLARPPGPRPRGAPPRASEPAPVRPVDPAPASRPKRLQREGTLDPFGAP
jgi:serine/threonine-protein kinase